MTNNERINNLKFYLDTLIEQNIYYGSIYKEYAHPYHRGYVIALDNIISRYRRALNSENITQSFTRFIARIDNNIMEKKVKCLVCNPKTKEEKDIAEGEIEKLMNIKINIHDILTEV